MELNLTSSAGAKKVNLAEARKLYEAALSTYDQDVNLWQDYHSMESKVYFKLVKMIKVQEINPV